MKKNPISAKLKIMLKILLLIFLNFIVLGAIVYWFKEPIIYYSTLAFRSILYCFYACYEFVISIINK